MNQKAIEKTELNKILSLAAEYAVTEGGRVRLQAVHPTSLPSEAKHRLKITEECLSLLFSYGLA